MKKVFIIALFCLIFPCQVLGIEEIKMDSSSVIELDVKKNEMEDVSTQPTDDTEYDKPFKQKLHDIFNLEVTDNEHAEYLLNNVLTKKFENGPLDSVGLWGLWRGGIVEKFEKGDNHTNVSYDVLETRIHGDFKDKKTSFVIATRFIPQKEFKFMQNFFSDVFIRHRFNDKAVLTIGNTRTHTGMEGCQSELLIPFYYRSQITQQFGNIRKLGTRLSGEFALMDYDIALNTSGTYFTSFFPGAEFCGWVNFKPLGKTDGRYGSLKIGGGLTSGRRHFNYNVVGGYVGYQYKRFKADFEIANGDGYNGRLGCANIHARGYYTTIYYDLTKKLQLLARYDEFTPDCSNSSHRTHEYSAGINYFIKGQALKVMLNYVFREDNIAGNSHRIIIGTQIVL